MSQKPLNVIILHCDEMRGDCAGFAGNLQVRTPCLDAFARESFLCENHFTVHGKCVPSRVSMMTGRYAHSNGTRTVMEEDLLPAERMDLMKHLRAAGYETAVFGINHCWQGFFNGNQPHGVVDWHSYVEPFHALTNRQVVTPPAGARADVPNLDDGFDLLGRITGPLPVFNDDVRTDAAIAYLRTVRDTSRPCFLQLNLSAPHPPYAVEEPWFSQYDPGAITPFPRTLPRRATLPFRSQRAYRTGTPDISEASVREVLATYYGMISKVDMLMGRVLNCLRELELLERSIVIFTSDHGDFAGQYGLCEKFDTVLADCLLHVPLIIRAPGIPRCGRTRRLTQHVDLPRTVLELLGMEPGVGWNIQGISLLDVINGSLEPAAVFADGGHERSMRQRFNAALWTSDAHTGVKRKATAGKQLTYREEPDAMARCCMVRTEDYKLVIRETGEHELYALRQDPWELDNRYGEAELELQQGRLMEQLVRWQLRTMDDLPFHPLIGA
jgi:arylsulfatase A-like enzyme